MRIAVHDSALAAGGRLVRALTGLEERGHALVLPGGSPGRAAHAGVDVVVGGAEPRGASWLAALTGARATLLGLEPGRHAAWSGLDRWAWSLAGAYGVIDEREVDAFLARIPAEDRERVALWPAAPAAPAREPGPASTHPDTQLLERCCERAIARRSAGPGRAALFVDRDGTLIAERHHLSDPDGVELLPGVAGALRSARSLGHPLVVISNQAGVGRGLYPESAVHGVMARLRRLLRAEGVELDAVRHCPHAPEAGCDCRKPGPRLLRESADDLRVSLRDSVMVGDKWIDVEAGRAAGAAGVLVRTGHGVAELAARPATGAGGEPPAAEAVCDDLPAAVRWFLERRA